LKILKHPWPTWLSSPFYKAGWSLCLHVVILGSQIFGVLSPRRGAMSWSVMLALFLFEQPYPELLPQVVRLCLRTPNNFEDRLVPEDLLNIKLVWGMPGCLRWSMHLEWLLLFLGNPVHLLCSDEGGFPFEGRRQLLASELPFLLIFGVAEGFLGFGEIRN